MQCVSSCASGRKTRFRGRPPLRRSIRVGPKSRPPSSPVLSCVAVKRLRRAVVELSRLCAPSLVRAVVRKLFAVPEAEHRGEKRSVFPLSARAWAELVVVRSRSADPLIRVVQPPLSPCSTPQSFVAKLSRGGSSARRTANSETRRCETGGSTSFCRSHCAPPLERNASLSHEGEQTRAEPAASASAGRADTSTGQLQTEAAWILRSKSLLSLDSVARRPVDRRATLRLIVSLSRQLLSPNVRTRSHGAGHSREQGAHTHTAHKTRPRESVTRVRPRTRAHSVNVVRRLVPPFAVSRRAPTAASGGLQATLAAARTCSRVPVW